MQRTGHSALMHWAVCLFASAYAMGAAPAQPTAVSPQPFVEGWRTVLKGKGALEMPLADQSWKIAEREISGDELNELERLLLPRLAADLKDEGSSYQPRDFYRQYAAARWKQYHIILVHGFHKEDLDDVVLRSLWMREPIDASDGGSGYWDAAYVVELHQFMKMKQDGKPARTVAFHGYA
jgi:hypothetical protein